jgi:hypothetical protein
MISKQQVKAFFIAALAFKFPVSWGRRKRCKMISLDGSKHRWIVRFLELFFDVRHRQDGGIELWFKDKERQKVNQRRFVKRLRHLI